MRALWTEVRRMGWALGVAVGALVVTAHLSEVFRLALVGYKLALVTIAWILWHLLRSQTFPYLDFRACLNVGGGRAVGAGLVLAATALAVILGITLGL